MRSGESSDHPPPERHPSAGSFEPQILSLTAPTNVETFASATDLRKSGNLSFCGYRGVPSIALLGRERVQPIAPYNLGNSLRIGVLTTRLYLADRPTGVMRVSGQREVRISYQKARYLCASILPDGKSLLYTTASRELKN